MTTTTFIHLMNVMDQFMTISFVAKETRLI